MPVQLIVHVVESHRINYRLTGQQLKLLCVMFCIHGFFLNVILGLANVVHLPLCVCACVCYQKISRSRSSRRSENRHVALTLSNIYKNGCKFVCLSVVAIIRDGKQQEQDIVHAHCLGASAPGF